MPCWSPWHRLSCVMRTHTRSLQWSPLGKPAACTNCCTRTHPILSGYKTDGWSICLQPPFSRTPCSDSNPAVQHVVPCLQLQTAWCTDIHSGCTFAAVYFALWFRRCLLLLPDAFSAHARALVCTRCIVSVCWMGIRKHQCVCSAGHSWRLCCITFPFILMQWSLKP